MGDELGLSDGFTDGRAVGRVGVGSNDALKDGVREERDKDSAKVGGNVLEVIDGVDENVFIVGLNDVELFGRSGMIDGIAIGLTEGTKECKDVFSPSLLLIDVLGFP